MKKWMLILLAMVVLAGGLFWARSSRGDETAEQDIIATDIPVPTQKGATVPELVGFEADFGNLTTKYPKTSVVETGANNNDDLQIITIESEQDANEFYFCVNLDEYAAGNNQDLSMPMLEVVKVESFPVNGINKNLYLVTFKNTRENASENDYQWALTENQPQVGDVKFVGEITNGVGRRLQVWGRFNCREDERPDIEVEDFNNSKLQQEARLILTNLNY